MTGFKCFETKEEAQSFVKKHGGMLTTRVLTPSGRKPATLKDYNLAVFVGGLNSEKYPYCVQWNERR